MAEVLSENDLNSDRETPDCDERLQNDVRKRLSFSNKDEADDKITTPSSDRNCDSCKNNSCNNNNNNNLSFSIDSILSSSSKRQRQKNENISKDTNSKEIEDITDESELKDSSHVLDFQSCPRLVKEDGAQGRDGENRSPSDSYYSIANHLAMWSYRDINKDRFGVVRRIGHPYQNRTPPKRKKPRTSFTRLQIMELERRFEQQKYLASSERSTIAKSLKMSDSQVKTWFQNRRTKWRRQTAEEKELERQAANRLLMSIGRCAGKNLPLNNGII